MEKQKGPLTLFGYEIPITFPITIGTIIAGGLIGFFAMETSLAIMNQELITVVRELQEHEHLEAHAPVDKRVIHLEVVVEGMAEDLREIRKVLVERGYDR